MQVAENWYKTIDVGDGVTLIREAHVARWVRCNIWHVRGRDRDLIVDTGFGLRPLAEAVARLAERPVIAIATHSHFDHSGGLHQFSHRLCHHAEAPILTAPTLDETLVSAGFVRAETFSALPYKGFDWRDYEVKAAAPTALIDEGDVIDLGDRAFRVLHLPGHSPGSVGLWEEATKTLFSGDAIYNGEMIDTIYHSDPEVYMATMERLRAIPAEKVHAGHFKSFGREKMQEIAEAFLAGGMRLGDTHAWTDAQTGNAG